MENLANIGAEVYAVLNKVPKVKYNMIPQKITELFEKYKEQSKSIKIDTSKKFEEQEISKQAKDIIFAISLNYWLTEDERKLVLEKINENEQTVTEKYNVDNLFQKQNEVIEDEIKEQSNMVSMTEYKEPLIKRIINKIKDFFRK